LTNHTAIYEKKSLFAILPVHQDCGPANPYFCAQHRG
jgi:hypothetical protein